MDNGSGFTKDGLHKVGQDSEHGRYSESFDSHFVPLAKLFSADSSKAYTPASLETVSTFGFRGEGN